MNYVIKHSTYDAWFIQDKDKKYHGTYKTKEEAVRQLCKLIDDGTITLPRLKPTRYISKKNDHLYCINKRIGGRTVYFGSFHSLEDAMRERDFLESIDWNWDDIDAE